MDGSRPGPTEDAIGNQRWRPFYNAGSIDVPAFGALEITGMTLRSAGGGAHPVLTARRPTSASLAGAAVNSHLPVPIGCYGECTFDFPTWVLYDTGSTPAYGEAWGTAVDLFTLSQGNTGFTIIGGQTTGRVYVERVAVSSSQVKILYLPPQDITNYVVPQKLDSTAYGVEWSPSLTNYFNFSDDELPIIDYFHSIALPGQWLTCQYSAALEAWTPIPSGQNAIQKARTYKTIEANSITSGNDIWLMSHDVDETEIFEISDMNNDTVFFEWATSGTDIEAAQGEPVEIWLYLMSGGWQVIGRACNP